MPSFQKIYVTRPCSTMLPLNTSLIVEAEQSERHDEVLCSEIEEELFELRYRQKGHFSSSIQL